MFKFSSTLAGVATLALATVPVLALTSAAHAAPAVVKVSDLGASDGQVLEQRIKVVARKVCTTPANQGGLSLRHACMEDVSKNVHETLAGRDSMTAKAQTTEIARR